MIASWYFCVCVQTTPSVTQAYLSILDVLRADTETIGGGGAGPRRENPGLVLAALGQLNLVEPSLRRYAIPYVMAAAVRYRHHAEVAAAATAGLADSLEVLEPTGRLALRSAWEALLGDRGPADVMLRVRDVARGLHTRPRRSPDDTPYLDIEDFVPELFAISLLLVAARQDFRTGRAIAADDDLKELLSQALRGGFGRWPLVLAVEVAVLAGEDLIGTRDVLDLVLSNRRGAPLHEPDLLSLIARLTFGYPSAVGSAAVGSTPVPAILTEAVSHFVLRGHRRGPRSRFVTDVLGRLELSNQAPGTVSIVLWQSVLWELATEMDAKVTALELKSWWLAPHRRTSATVRVAVPLPKRQLDSWVADVRRLAGLSNEEAPDVVAVTGNALQHSNLLAVAATSPWLYRDHDRYVERTGRTTAEQVADSCFPAAANSLALFRLFAAASTAISLLRVPSVEARRHLIALSLHATDVLDDPRHRSYLSHLAQPSDQRKPEPSMTPAMAGLALYTFRTVQRAGQGGHPEIEPQWFTDFILDPNGSRAEQERFLTGEPALQIGGTWALNALSGSTPTQDDATQARWRTGRADGRSGRHHTSPAEQVLIAAARGLRRPLAVRAAATLRCFFHRDEETRHIEPWHAGGRQPAGVATFWEVIGTGRLTAADWRLYNIVTSKNKKIKLALQTERLLTGISASSPGDQDRLVAWASQWRAVLNSGTETIDFPRVIRLRLLELLAAEMTGTEAQRGVLEDVLDAEIEFGLGTPLDRWLLFERLGSGAKLPLELAQSLRLRLLRGLYQRQAAARHGSTARDPRTVADDRHADVLLTTLLERFLHESGRTDVALGAQALEEYVRDLWIGANQAAGLSEVRSAPAGEIERVTVDGRLLVGTTIDPLTGTTRMYLRRPSAPFTSSGAQVVDVHGVDPHKVIQGLHEQATYVRGILCAVDQTAGFVNCGFGDAVAARLGEGDYRVGETVALPLRRALLPPHFEVAGPIERLAEEPQVGDIRPTTVSRHDGAGPARLLRIQPANARSFDPADLPPQAHRLWEPDLIGSFDTAWAADVQTHARWTGAHWLPVDWPLAECLALMAPVLREHGTLRLVLIGEADTPGIRRFSVAPGRNVVIADQSWSRPEAITQLIDGFGWNAWGLVVHARVDATSDGPRLTLVQPDDGGPAIDSRGVRWRQLFDEVRDYEARIDDNNTWWIASGISGMPPVTVTGLDGRGATICQFTPLKWADAEQRAALIRGNEVDTRKLNVVSPPTVEAFTRLMDVSAGTLVTLNGLRRESAWSLITAYTTDGLAVDLELESLHFGRFETSDRLAKGLRIKRPAVVSYASRPPSRKPGLAAVCLADSTLLAAVAPADRDAAEDMLVRAETLRGIAIQAPRSGSDPRDTFVVWLALGDTVGVCTLLRENFDPAPFGAGAIVEGHRTAAGWGFTASRRRIRARALWEVEEETQPRRNFMYLGTVLWRGERRAVAQSLDMARLYVYDQAAGTPPAHLAVRGGSADWQAALEGTVEPANFVRDGRQRITVRLGTGMLTGDIGQLNPGSDAQVIGVDLQLEFVGERTVTARRTFVLTTAHRESNAIAQAGTDEHDGFLRYLAGEREPLTGRLEQRTVRLDVPWLVSIRGTSTRVVPLAADEGPWVQIDDLKYTNEKIRVVLDGERDSLTASYRKVPARTLAEYWDYLRQQGAVLGDRGVLHDRLYFVDAHETAQGMSFRFEWGYGHTVALTAEQLTIGGKPYGSWAATPFHGDRIFRVLVSRDAATGAYKMDIAPQHIHPDFMSEVYREARQNVVHLAVIDGDPDGGRPHIVALHSRWRSTMPTDRPYRDYQEVAVRRARLSRPAVDSVTAALRASVRRTDEKALAYVRLDTKKFARSGGATVVFDFVEPGFGENGLQKGMRTFFIADAIDEIENDYRLTLTMHDVLGGDSAAVPSVTVLRREFSQRQNLLGQMFRGGGSDTNILRGAVFLVEVLRTFSDQIPAHGRIKGGLTRSVNVLHSRVRNDPSPCYAFAKTVTGDRLELELRPNVVFQLGRDQVSNGAAIGNGSIVRVTTEGSDGLALMPALIGDAEYLPAGGRPAIVLPMQNLLRQRDRGAEALRQGTFTVAGLPSIVIAATGEYPPSNAIAHDLLATAHPKTALIETVKPGRYRFVQPTEAIRCGRLASSAESAALIQQAGHPDRRLPWAQLTFLDAGAQDVRRHCERGRWHYHDATTAHRNGPGLNWVTDPTPLPEPARFTEEVVFFDDRWSLRYGMEDLARFGLPASDLVDGATGRELSGRKTTYPVAGVSRRAGRAVGCWLEIAPGRVVDLVGSMLMPAAGLNGRLLESMDWTHIAPGDLMEISVERNDPTDIARLVLHRWLPGPRGAFGPRTLLRVTSIDRRRSAMRLGTGAWFLDYPIESDVRLPRIGSSVWLTADNAVIPATHPHAEIKAGDVVTLTSEEVDGESVPRVHGLSGRAVRLSPDDRFVQPWLRQAFDDQAQRTALLRLCEGLPLTVEELGPESIVVSRRVQNDAPPLAGTVVPVAPIGLPTAHTILLRRGSRLSVCTGHDMVPGLPPELLPDAITALAAARVVMWLATDGRGRSTFGLSTWTADDSREIRVKPLRVLESGGNLGVLCWDPRSCRPRWLPVAEAAWTRLTNADLQQHIVLRGSELPVRILRDGTASLIRTAANHQRFTQLHLGDQIRIVAAGLEPSPAPGRRVRFLARVYLSDILLDLHVEATGTAPTSDPTLYEVEAKVTTGGSYVSACSIGGRRLAVDIPGWALTKKPPEHFARYVDWAEEGLTAGTTARTPDEAVLRIALSLDQGWTDTQLADAAIAWLSASGAALRSSAAATPLDAAPAIAAVLVLDAAGKTALPAADTFAGAAVHLCRLVGIRAARSRHLEPIVNEWVLNLQRRPRGILWQRLAKLLPGTVLKTRDLQNLRAADRGIQARTTLQPDPHLQVVSACFAATAGAQRDYDEIEKYDGQMGRLVDLGRSLTPHPRSVFAQQRLVQAQHDYLAAVLREVLRNGPMILLPVPPALQDSRWDDPDDPIQLLLSETSDARATP